eukprot:1134660-Amphidinium_carterae.1
MPQEELEEEMGLEPVWREPAHRRFYITRRMIAKYGVTDGCAGCITVGKHHDEACRDRVLKRILEDPEERPAYERRLGESKRARAAVASDDVGGEAEPAASVEDAVMSAPVEVGDRKRVEKRAPEVALEDLEPNFDEGRRMFEKLVGAAERGKAQQSPLEATYLHPVKGWDMEKMRSSLRGYELLASHVERQAAGGSSSSVETHGDKMEVTALAEGEVDFLEPDKLAVQQAMDDSDVLAGVEEWHYFDGDSGIALPPEKVHAGMKAELGDYERLKVYEVVGDEVCFKATGVVLCAAHYKVIGSESIFAATPPLAGFKFVISRCLSAGGGRKLQRIDFKRALLHAEISDKQMYVKPPHLRQTSQCWHLLRAMYGTLSAAGDFQHAAGSWMVDGMAAWGLSKGWPFRCDADLKWIEGKLGERFELKVKAKIGPDENDDKNMVLLNRVLEWTDRGVYWESDPRHTELLLAEVGMLNCKGLATPAVKHSLQEHENAQELLEGQIKCFRAAAARAMFMAQDRPDLSFAAKEACRGMSAPKDLHLRILKRICRYVAEHRRLRQLLVFQERPGHLTVWSDTDHAGCPVSRRSTSGGVISHG